MSPRPTGPIRAPFSEGDVSKGSHNVGNGALTGFTNQWFKLPIHAIQELGNCLRDISERDAYVVLSTCGGDKEVKQDGSEGPTHFWPGKEKGQKELAKLLQMPVLSGVGFVDGTPEGGVRCDGGWH